MNLNNFRSRSDSHLIEPPAEKPWRSGADLHDMQDDPHAGSERMSLEEQAFFAEMAAEDQERRDAEARAHAVKLDWAMAQLMRGL